MDSIFCGSETAPLGGSALAEGRYHPEAETKEIQKVMLRLNKKGGPLSPPYFRSC